MDKTILKATAEDMELVHAPIMQIKGYFKDQIVTVIIRHPDKDEQIVITDEDDFTKIISTLEKMQDQYER